MAPMSSKMTIQPSCIEASTVHTLCAAGPLPVIQEEAHPLQVALLDKLREICPEQLTRFFFCNSGSEAVENAIKIARGHTKKQNIIAFEVA